MKEIKTVIRNVNPFVSGLMGYDFNLGLEEFDKEVNKLLQNGFALKRREFFDNRILYVELEREV